MVRPQKYSSVVRGVEELARAWVCTPVSGHQQNIPTPQLMAKDADRRFSSWVFLFVTFRDFPTYTQLKGSMHMSWKVFGASESPSLLCDRL